MRSPRHIKSITEVALTDIHVGARLRDVDPAGVEGIRASLEEGGVLLNPITVRKVAHRDDRLELIAGRHRIEAARLLGWETISATVWDCSDDWARMMELHENLGRRDLNALDRAVFMAQAKSLYERLHPHTKKGVAGANGRWNDATALNAVASFAAATAEATGLKERQIYSILAAGQHLGPDEIVQLRGSARKATLADLQKLAKLADKTHRETVVRHMVEGEGLPAAKAMKFASGQAARAKRDPADAAFDTLVAAWNRAPQGVKARFRRYVNHGIAPQDGDT